MARKFFKSIAGQKDMMLAKDVKFMALVFLRKKNYRKVIYLCDVSCEKRTDQSFRYRQLCHIGQFDQSSLFSIESPIDKNVSS